LIQQYLKRKDKLNDDKGIDFNKVIEILEKKFKIVSEQDREGYNLLITRTIALNRLIHSFMIIQKEVQKPELQSKIDSYKIKAQDNILKILDEIKSKIIKEKEKLKINNVTQCINYIKEEKETNPIQKKH
jgi:hypothetical protein